MSFCPPKLELLYQNDDDNNDDDSNDDDDRRKLSVQSSPYSFVGNAELSCYPGCLAEWVQHNVVSVDAGVGECAVSGQDIALCGLVAATNIQSVYPEWECTTSGFTVSDPCDPNNMWRGIDSCNGGQIEYLDISNNDYVISGEREI
jgi:hypothetical protein